MGLFYSEVKKAAPKKPKSVRRADIPIASLNKLGCSVCPRDLDEEDLRSPKMEPSGVDRPLVYLLGTGPNKKEDKENLHWVGPAGEEIISKIGPKFFKRHVRCGHITQCMPAGADDGLARPGEHEIECCRSRVVADIEESKPLVIVGVGDATLWWACPDLPRNKVNALNARGRLIATKIGNHLCWFYPILYPHYVHKKKKFGRSEYEIAVEVDLRELLLQIHDLNPPTIFDAPYDAGIEYITGNEPGDMQRLERALNELAALPEIAIDLETGDGKTGLGILRPWMTHDPKIWLCAIGTYERTVAFGMDHPECWGTEARRKRVWELVGEFLLKSGRKIAHNLALEQEWFGYFYGDMVLRLTEWGDTMAMTFVLDEREGTKSLEVQSRFEFGFNLKAQSRVDAVRLLEYPLKDAMRYNGMDTKWTHMLSRRLWPKILATPKYRDVYEQKIRTAPTLVIMEAKGLPVDLDYAEAQAKSLQEEMATVEAKLRRCPEIQKYKERFGTFSVTNADHALKLMRDICKREEIQREDRDGAIKWTSDEEALSAMPANEVPSARLILDHRAAAKLYSTYIEPILGGKIISVDGLIHAKYSSMRTVTGRLAGEDPNPQNWPKRKRKEIRGVICAPDGAWIIACDYGQIEFRVVGMASGDEAIIEACWTGYDVHLDWAERMVKRYGAIKDWVVREFHVDWDEKGIKTLRQEAKNKWVFPQLFGASTHSCATSLQLPDDVAEDLGADFWDVFRGTKKWQEKLLRSYEKNLYVETLCGQRRRGPMTKNEIINMPIQGTAAEIVIEGMNALSERAFELDDLSIHPNLNVHDDLSTVAQDAGLEQRIEIIVHEMCKHRFDFINVPLMVEVSIGKRWHELEEIGKYSSAKLFNLENPYG